ncbi:MAG: S8 family peptidase [Bacteroidetes bacterium]|nr:S8 family peptidase [Bacteroidota bacterium]MDA0904426.1 S8 family peptidase [Bacteroidota bacterium]MDA1243270.1 S8 family peptidase [Bacteroidota bacterium]
MTHRTIVLLGLVCVLSHPAQAQTLASPDRLALNELTQLAAEFQEPKQLVHVAGGHPVALVNGAATVGFLGHLEDGVSESAWRDWAAAHVSVTAGACRNGIASFRVNAYQLSVLEDLPMGAIELASRAVPDLNKARYGTRVDSVHAGLNLPQPFHGEGVLIGVLDWGFDYTHPMFYDTALTASRIRAVWDQYRQAGPAPGDYGYGTEAATPWEIQLMESDTSNVYGYSTHGTHVAGIAGGSGAGIGLTGMAPAAEFLFATLMVDEAAALDAFEWMASVAEADGKRLVINNSWGLPQWGVPDGTGLSNQFIDALSAEGVVFVSSNGNNGDSDFHLDHTFAGPGDTIRSRVQFYPLSANPNAWGQNLTLWGEPGESFSAGFLLTQGISNVVGTSPMYDTSDGPLVLDTIQVTNGDTVVYDVAMEAAHPSNGRPFLQMRIHKGSSNLAVVLQATAESGRVHAWNHTHLSNDVGNWGQDFQAAQPSWLGGDPYYGVQQPACGQTVIAVGAYSSEYLNSQGTEVGGSLANFSTYGPTLDERLKPNVSAPGVSVESSLSSFRDGNYAVTSTAEFDGTTYEFAKLSGTSMSGPATAGVVALMLEANPTLTPGDVRAILEWTARQDDNTGTLPEEGDFVWGHGKVTASRAVLASLDWISWLELPNEAPPGLFIHPNPAQQTTYVDVPAQSLHNTSFHWQLIDMAGQICLEGVQTLPMVLSLENSPQGMLLLQVRNAKGDVWSGRVLHLE